MQNVARCLAVAAIVSAIGGSRAQLLANVKNFVSNIPTFNSNNNPSFAVQDGRVNVDVPVPQNLHFGTVDPKTGTWELTDKSLGAGVTVGPHGAQLLTATPSMGNTQFQQAAALGANGLTIGPNKVNAPSSEQERQAQGNLGIQNLKIGKDGLIVNDGSRLNSSVLVDPQGIQLNGNPTGGGESHLYIKPNFNVLGQQFGQAAPPQESKNNVQLSYGDGKTTATEQLKGYTNYQLDPNKGTYAQVPNRAPPFMGVNPSANGKYTSYAQAQAPAPSQARAQPQQQGTMQDGGTSAGYAAQAPMKQYQVVQTPNPRRFEYANDLASGSPQAAAAYAKQIGGSVQQAQQQMDQRQQVFNQLQTQLNAENAGRGQAVRVPTAVPVPPPAYQDRGFQRLGGMSDAASLAVAADLSNSGVTSFAQQSFAPGQAPQLSKDLGPAVATQPEGAAPGPAGEGDMDLQSFLQKKKKRKGHAPAPAPSQKHHKKNETTPEKQKKAATSTPAASVVGRANALDNETPATPGGLDPAQVTAAAKNEAVASGSGKAISTLPTPQNGGATPTPTPTPVPYSPNNPPNPAAYVHSLLSDKTAEVVGENFLAISPTAGVPEPDFFEMPALATSLLASPVKAPAPAPVQAPAAAPKHAARAPAPARAHAPGAAPKRAGAQFQAHAPKQAATVLPRVPGQTREERFREALAIINEQNAASATRAPAPAPAYANAGTSTADQTAGRRMLRA